MSETPRPGADPTLRFHEALNDAQLAAVQAPDGPHLVVAGAGTGKTRTLVHRVAWLIHRGVTPESILLLTFTRRAAQEMLRRASSLVDERCRRVAGGTFHAFANNVLRRHGARIGLSPQFTILDRADAVDLIGLVRAEAGYERQGRRFPRAESLLELYSKHVNTQRSLKDLLLAEMPQFEDDLDAVTDLYGRFQRRKLEQNLADYDDLLVHLRNLLANHAEARQELAARYRYLLVDEFQDTNRLQAHIAALLASVHKNIMVVGDEAQSIYSFRGASFRNIIDFPKIFPGARTTLLEQSYRSTQKILDLGNAVLDKAKEKFPKRLFSLRAGDQRPILLRVRDDLAQAEFICRRVLELREQGVPLGQMAVLARAAWHSNTLELELANHNIPFKKFGGIRFVDSAHVKDVSALLRLAANPLDVLAWHRVLQLFEGIGAKIAQNITGHVLERDGDVRVLVQPKLAIKPYGPSLRELSELLQVVADPQLALASRLEELLDRYKGWMTRKYDDAALRAKDLDALRVIAARHQDIESFLAELAIDPPDFSRGRPDDDPEDEWLTVSTIHSAKGLEWHSVFLVNLNAGRFPTWQSMTSENDFEEERRLLYVAVTRAKENLFLLKPEEILTRGQSYEVGELSPLLADLDRLEQLVEQRIYTPQPDGGQGAGGAATEADDREQLQRIQDYFSF
jgi:DNA helicase-2/ATP-dependent DNA helicase PcrA